MTIIFHIPTESEMALRRQGGQFSLGTIEGVAQIIEKNQMRDYYGNTENTITLTIPSR